MKEKQLNHLFLPPEIVPAGEHFAGAAILDEAAQGRLRFFLTATLPVALDEIHPDAAVGFREGIVVCPGLFIGLEGI